jgi:hypothetical protein
MGWPRLATASKFPPPRGYWAKKAAGKKVIQYRLQERGADVPDSTVITPTPFPPKLSPTVELATSKIETIIVRERLTKPHPITAGWISDREERLRQARLERDPFRRSLMAVADWSATDRRRHRILDTLFKAAEQEGITVRHQPRVGTYFEVAGEQVAFKLREKLRQIRKPQTPDEMQRLYSGEKPWNQELEPIGLLSFSIESYVDLPRRNWNESEARPLEGQLNEILAMLLAAGPLLAERRRQREEAEKRRQEEERRRYQETQRKRLDDNRWRGFADHAARWRKAEEIRSFLTALEQHPDAAGTLPDGTLIAEWLAWARERLVRFDPMTRGPAGVFEELKTITEWTYRD